MFCKMSTARVLPENIGVLTEWVKNKWGPLISKQHGFKQYYLVANPEGEVVFVMLWEREDQIQAWTDYPQHRDIVPEFINLVTGPVAMNIYEVKDAVTAQLL